MQAAGGVSVNEGDKRSLFWMGDSRGKSGRVSRDRERVSVQ